ncbi:hypothetical protein [Nocardia terpenica]|uniref:Uncharacterized protein n=1 Tax=Nocardia terpenica TaxID=455432 RepID=A0A164PFK3_9NOCA|nr:hypothetical protein [Nocardia terpenica]KZM75501.1 hypothetical protein AWN90_19165 [Nocardia terpenica]NQE85971.1 hypothetical protein [Nocardia terpenica]
MTTAGLHDTAPAALREPCPLWCERPDDHGWEDNDGTDLICVHRRTIPISGTDHGSLMVLRTEYYNPTGIERDLTTYVIDTGLGGDCELDAVGAHGLATALAQALTLTAEPP